MKNLSRPEFNKLVKKAIVALDVDDEFQPTFHESPDGYLFAAFSLLRSSKTPVLHVPVPMTGGDTVEDAANWVVQQYKEFVA